MDSSQEGGEVGRVHAIPFRLAFVQLVCPAYKVSMFERISRIPGVRLTLFVGDEPPPLEAPGLFPLPIPHIATHNRFVSILGHTVVWQQLMHAPHPKDYDLVLLPDGLLYLSNYVIMLRYWWNGVPFGLYTHGYNHQRRRTAVFRLTEAIRAFVHRRCDVLVVYSDAGAHFLHRVNRVPQQRIFVARNTIDVDAIARNLRRVGLERVAQLRADLGARPEDIVLVYLGRMESVKRPEWVIDAVIRLRQRGLPVRGILVGDGDRLQSLRKRVARLPVEQGHLFRLVGRLPMEDVDLHLAAGDITVMPGITGLAIVHSFAVGRPYVTVDCQAHGPEIDYLQQGVNGLCAPDSLNAFCDAIASLVKNRELRLAMGSAALRYARDHLSPRVQTQGFQSAITYVRETLSRPQHSGRTPQDVRR